MMQLRYKLGLLNEINCVMLDNLTALHNAEKLPPTVRTSLGEKYERVIQINHAKISDDPLPIGNP